MSPEKPPITEKESVARGAALESERTTQVAEVAAVAKAEEAATVSHGQRTVNLIWERTQQIIALGVVAITLLTAAFLVVAGKDSAAAFTLLASLANLVIGFYFGRTNHTRVGGVGPVSSSER